MRRLSSTIGSVLVALVAATGSAAAQEPALALKAAVEACATSPLPAQRVVSFVGSMPAMRGALVMQMRFDLERRMRGEPRWRRLRGVPGFGVWERSDPNVAGFVFRKRVTGLPTPASYRALVRFRWDDAGGSVVREDRRSRWRWKTAGRTDTRMMTATIGKM